MGLRPINGVWFGDTMTYYFFYEDYNNSNTIYDTKDVLFNEFLKFCAQFIPVKAFFMLCAALYIIPLYLVSKKWFQEYWFYAFLMFITSFSFWSYGTNGVRSGLAASFVLLAITREKRLWQISWFLIAVGFHKTMLVPILGYVLSLIYNRPKYFLALWLICIPLSLLLGSFWESFFGSLGFEEDRLRYLTQGAEGEIDKDIKKTGFRWDFLIYSASAVVLGCYYIFWRGFKDKTYYLLFNTYLFANAFWILVIRSNFTNRIAYLSWFIIALIACYPLLKRVIIPQQHKKLGLLIVIYFMITFALNIVLN
jgi:hypothetical protein